MEINPVPYKSGIRTSEFWVSVGTMLIFVGVMAGVVQQNEVDGLTKSVATIAAAVPAVVSIVEYIRGRTRYKLGSQQIYERELTARRRLELGAKR